MACKNNATPVGKFFRQAKPIWAAGLQYEKNLTLGLRAQFQSDNKDPVVLNITGSSLYRIYLNGIFIGHGPARAGHGYYRVDEWDLTPRLISGDNVLAIEIAGYNVNSYYLLDQSSFIQAEVVSGGDVLLATSADDKDFEAFPLTGRIQKVPRYSFQRPFTEYYQLEPGFDDWHNASDGKYEKMICEEVGEKKPVSRRIPYPDFSIRKPVQMTSEGGMSIGIKRKNYWKDRAVLNIGEKLGGFPESELVYNPAMELQEMEIASHSDVRANLEEPTPFGLSDKQFVILDFGTNLSGFVGARLEVTRPGRFFFTFDEILTNEDVNFRRLGCISAITYDLAPGSYNLESFEPYTLRYLKLIAIDGACNVKEVYLREYVNPDTKKADFVSSDPRLNRIYRAGVETFRQNAVDIFMDCPHRERAGWLCDSYFTARVAWDVSGNTLVEKNFFENFLLPDQFETLPEGMLPMCYPADHNDGVFIPNWAMWFVVQLREYLYRSQDRELVDALKPKVLKLIEYFEPFKNDDGLLEKLDSWVFVEWSAANRYVQDVNYPSNMLFAGMLDAAGDLYGLDDLTNEAKAIRQTIRQQAFNGKFFVDNAVRTDDGQLQVTSNTTEVCQYYAFYFNIATPDTHPGLWQVLTEEFGPRRNHDQVWPEVHRANAFIGNYLRLELLSQYGLKNQLLDECVNFFDYMALRTGTLWENISPHASCNHGFASHVVHVLYRDLLGIADVDVEQNIIKLQFSNLDLTSCKGQVPVGDDIIKLEWEKSEKGIHYRVEHPDGFKVVIQNNSDLALVKR
jgi:alpha-L-rhamnosidase